MTEPAAWVRARLGIEPGDARLFAAALTHRSASGANNERLEFLGDAVLNLIVADILYRRFPEASEGDLSRLRARVVSTEPLAEIAVSLGLGEALRLGSGELKTGGFRRASILADAFEALCGACYLDGGLQAARDALQPLVLPRIEALPDPSELKDAKTRLQEYLQSRGLGLPRYSIERIEGEPHAHLFHVLCQIPKLGLTAPGSGASRRKAEQSAAQAILAGLEGA